MNKLRISKILIIGAVLLITAFQAYWLIKLYHTEEETLAKTIHFSFFQSMNDINLKRMRNDTILNPKDGVVDRLFVTGVNIAPRIGALPDSPNPSKVFIYADTFTQRETHLKVDSIHPRKQVFFQELKDLDPSKIKSITIIKDSSIKIRSAGIAQDSIKIVTAASRTSKNSTANSLKGKPKMIQITLKDLLQKKSTLYDSIPLSKIDSAFKKILAKNDINLPYLISKQPYGKTTYKVSLKSIETGQFPIGFNSGSSYKATIFNPASYIIKKISPQIIVSLLVIVFTIISFVFLYRSLASQKRLTEIKNDFISNITHELKTPIATVNVAVEALRSFGVLQDPERSKEYLDISALELQRLSLLVDKVLKLSLFENKEIELNIELIDLLQLIQEVMATMKLQFDKHKAGINLITEGEQFLIKADKIHITGVIYNLLDNALKYSKDDPQITITLSSSNESVMLSVQDNGIGIAREYQPKIFDKFFRVPTGDKHNIKGYGLGLSYVYYIIEKHKGRINLQSEFGKGSIFTIKLPMA